MKWVAAMLMLPAVACATPSPYSVINGKLAAADWRYVAQKVAAGDQAWLKVVPALAARADRKQADLLEDALATALPLNTKGVLTTLQALDAGSYPEMQGTRIVCVQKVVQPGTVAEAYYNITRRALLDEPDGAQCLWNLEGVWEEVKQKND